MPAARAHCRSHLHIWLGCHSPCQSVNTFSTAEQSVNTFSTAESQNMWLYPLCFKHKKEKTAASLSGEHTYESRGMSHVVWVTWYESRGMSHVVWVTWYESRGMSHVVWVSEMHTLILSLVMYTCSKPWWFPWLHSGNQRFVCPFLNCLEPATIGSVEWNGEGKPHLVHGTSADSEYW